MQTVDKRKRLWDGTGSFIDYMAKSYAPVGATNDPAGLNSNWPRNVKSALQKNGFVAP